MFPWASGQRRAQEPRLHHETVPRTPCAAVTASALRGRVSFKAALGAVTARVKRTAPSWCVAQESCEATQCLMFAWPRGLHRPSPLEPGQEPVSRPSACPNSDRRWRGFSPFSGPTSFLASDTCLPGRAVPFILCLPVVLFSARYWTWLILPFCQVTNLCVCLPRGLMEKQGLRALSCRSYTARPSVLCPYL